MSLDPLRRANAEKYIYHIQYIELKYDAVVEKVLTGPVQLTLDYLRPPATSTYARFIATFDADNPKRKETRETCLQHPGALWPIRAHMAASFYVEAYKGPKENIRALLAPLLPADAPTDPDSLDALFFLLTVLEWGHLCDPATVQTPGADPGAMGYLLYLIGSKRVPLTVKLIRSFATSGRLGLPIQQRAIALLRKPLFQQLLNPPPEAPRDPRVRPPVPVFAPPSVFAPTPVFAQAPVLAPTPVFAQAPVLAPVEAPDEPMPQRLEVAPTPTYNFDMLLPARLDLRNRLNQLAVRMGEVPRAKNVFDDSRASWIVQSHPQRGEYIVARFVDTLEEARVERAKMQERGIQIIDKATPVTRIHPVRPGFKIPGLLPTWEADTDFYKLFTHPERERLAAAYARKLGVPWNDTHWHSDEEMMKLGL